MPLIAELLERSGRGWAEIERLAVGTGPGTFTGLRIGVATARALANARGIPLLGVSTLESLALSASRARGAAEDEAHQVILSVLDARRRQVFAAAWPLRRGEPAFESPLLAPSALDPAELAALAANFGAPPLAVGDGAVDCKTVLERSGAVIPDGGSPLHRVTALGHVERARSLDAGDAGTVFPQYLRLPDAELARSASRQR